MENYNFKAPGMSRDETRRLSRIIKRGHIESDIFKICPPTKLERFINSTDPNLCDSWVGPLAEKFFDFNGYLLVPVNYGNPEEIVKAVDDARLDRKIIDLPFEKFKFDSLGKVVREVREVHFDRSIGSQDLPQALNEIGRKRGYRFGSKFADPLTALRFAGIMPDRQRKHPLAVFFNDIVGRLWNLCLYEKNGKRSLHIGRGYLMLGNNRDTRFLTVWDDPLAA